MKIRSQILTPDWPAGIDLLESTDLETRARTLRYRALGIACRDNGISFLALAHHADDQAETILLRLIQRHWRSGLRGVASVGMIPECFGIHGVHKSSSNPDDVLRTPAMDIEARGVQLLRPLLRYGKEQLIATCEEQRVSWVEDATNQDKTLTTRNAIRHITKHHTLPKALSKDRLLALSTRIQERIKSHEEAAESLFNKIPLILDPQTGSLIVQLPPRSALLDRPIITPEDEDFAHNTGTLLLNRIIELVSPMGDESSISNVAGATDTIYPRTLSSSSSSTPQNDSANNTRFTIQGVWFRRTDTIGLLQGFNFEPPLGIKTRPGIATTHGTSCRIRPSRDSTLRRWAVGLA